MWKSVFLIVLSMVSCALYAQDDTPEAIAKVSIVVQDDDILLNIEDNLDKVSNISDPKEKKKKFRELMTTSTDYVWSPKMQKLADEGNAAAQNAIGYCLQFGKGCEIDLDKAVSYYKLAAEKGNHKALNNLGNCYEHGIIVEQDYKQAYILYKKAALAGHEMAMNNLAQCYMRGMGTKEDYYKARAWFEKTANSRGERVAIVNTGFLYYQIGDDYDKAFNYLTKGAEMGSPRATECLADCYKNGYGCKQDIPKAISLFEKVLTMPERLSEEEYAEIRRYIQELKNLQDE